MNRTIYITIPLVLLFFSCTTIEKSIDSYRFDEEEYFHHYGFELSTMDIQTKLFQGQADALLWSFSVSPENPKGTVLLLHGYLDHSMINASTIKLLYNLQYRVICMDLPGHGLSDGERASLEDFLQYQIAFDRLIEVWGLSGEELILMGHSTGGAIILDALIRGFKPASVILVAPLIQFRQWELGDSLLNYEFIENSVVPSLPTPTTSNREFEKWKSNDPLKIKQVPLKWAAAIVNWEKNIPWDLIHINIPALVLQGKKDGVVYWEHNIPLLKKLLLLGEFIYFPDYKHHLLNEADNQDIFQAIEAFLN